MGPYLEQLPQRLYELQMHRVRQPSHLDNKVVTAAERRERKHLRRRGSNNGRQKSTCLCGSQVSYLYVSGRHRKDLPYKYHQFVEVTRPSLLIVRL